MFRFNKHWELDGKHAFLGASKSAWINYDLPKMEKIWENQFKSIRGSELHAIAKILIEQRLKLADNGTTLSLYVNDAIGYRMKPEVVLKASENAFGTADAISVDTENREVRIFDLKTGNHVAYFHQHHIYGAYLCREYRLNPFDWKFIFRIYQNDQVHEILGDVELIKRIMDKQEEFEPHIERLKEVMMRD